MQGFITEHNVSKLFMIVLFPMSHKTKQKQKTKTKQKKRKQKQTNKQIRLLCL